MHPDPDILMYGNQIPFVDETKFLRLIFDKKLSFIPHIRYIKKKCQKAINLLKVVAHTDWGADRTTLLQLYRSLVRSKLDYGCFIYGSARKSYINMLKPIQNQGLRLCLGAFRTSPEDSLAVESDQLPLHLRREKLALQYAIKVAANPTNPAYDCIFNPNYVRLFINKPNVIPPIGIRLLEPLRSINFNPNNICKLKYPDTPPWTMSMGVDLSLCEHKKSITDTAIFMSKFNEIRERYFNYEHIYTDGSSKDNKSAAAAVMDDHCYSGCLPDGSSIYAAELHAIYLALDHAETSSSHKFVIFSDSKSTLQAIREKNWINPYVLKILERCHVLFNVFNKTILFCWVPSHIGIRGNEQADRAAKAALDQRPTDMLMLYTDFKRPIFNYVRGKWQTFWHTQVNNKLYNIQADISKRYYSSRQIRREEAVLTRVRIGHSQLTHGYILKGEDQPECYACGTFLTMKHIFIDCTDFTPARSKYFNVASMQQLFTTVTADHILSFLKEIGLFNKL